mmetsp:Transcript_108232/g.248194  ORF Transcript_108232/g.248194 Transcript_108232/m.248194 type:complete len:525 (-) Transcript_108232:159-1733(-)
MKSSMHRVLFLRKVSTVKSAVKRLKAQLQHRLVDKLQQVPIFKHMSRQDIAEVAGDMVQERFAAGEAVFHKVEAHSPLYFVLKGRVRVKLFWPAESGAQGDTDSAIDTFEVTRYQLFGETALLTGMALASEAVALQDTRVLKIQTKNFHNVLSKQPRAQQFVTMMAVERLQETAVFRAVTPSLLARLVNFMTQVELEAGDVLFHDVDSFCPIYFIVLGTVEIIYDGDRNKSRVYRANDLIGTEHLVTGIATRGMAVAQERTSVLQCSRSDFEKLCAQDSRLKQAVEASFAEAREPQKELSPRQGATTAKPGYATFKDLGWGTPTSDQETDVGPAVPKVLSLGISENDGQEAFGDAEILENEVEDLHHAHGSKSAALMIWLGILIDGIPESFVLGILSNNGDKSSLITFVIGVFLANFPEAMSSSGTMKACGMKVTTILAMWSTIVVGTGFGAALGAALFPPGSSENEDTLLITAGIEGLCGGAMLTMIANTVLPEAFEQGGNVVGLSCLMGFMAALAVKSISMS